MNNSVEDGGDAKTWDWQKWDGDEGGDSRGLI